MMATPRAVRLRDDAVEQLDLVVGEGRGRLVHLDDPGVEADRLGDLDDLLLGDRERADPLAGPDAGDAEPGEQLLGVALHPAVSTEAAAAGLAAEVDVLGDRALGQQVELLEDRRDAGAAAPAAGGRTRPASPAISIVPGVGLVDAGEDLHQRGLAGAVLADQAEHLAGAELEVDVVENRVADEALRQPARSQHDVPVALGVGAHRGRSRASCHGVTVACVTALLSRVRQKLFAGRSKVASA